MLWDGFIVFFAIAFAVAGWSMGFMRSWPSVGPVILATIVSQIFYVDFSAFVVEQLLVPSNLAVFIAYLTLWLSVDVIGEIILDMLLYRGTDRKLNPFNRAGGAVLGLAKCSLVLVFGSVVAMSTTTIPDPPKYDEKATIFIDQAPESHVLQASDYVARHVPKPLRKLIASQDEPHYQVSFASKTSNGGNSKTAKIMQEVQRIKDMLNEAHSLD